MKNYLLLCFFFASTQMIKAQPKWSNYIGIHLSTDAVLFYIGPSIQIGTDYQIKENLSISGYAQYFQADNGPFSYMTATLAILVQKKMGKKKRFYMALGPAYQRAIEEDEFDPDDAINRSTIILAHRMGYVIPLKKITVCIETSSTGPYISSDLVELYSLLSIGTRIYFHGKKSKIDYP